MTSKVKETGQPDEKFKEDLVKAVTEDFKARQKERLSYERQWELNLNYLLKNGKVRIVSVKNTSIKLII